MKVMCLSLAAMCVLAVGGCGGQGPGSGAWIDVPEVIEGTTVGAALTEEPACIMSGPTVWYRFDRDEKARIAVCLKAKGDLEAMLCAVRGGPEGSEGVGRARTDDRGDANLDFDADLDTTYYLGVIQDPESEPDAYTLGVSALARPRNDERVGAIDMGSLPSSRTGTTVGATVEDGDPACDEGNPSVWYRLGSPSAKRVVVHLNAESGVKTDVCALKKVRSHLLLLDDNTTDDRGLASVAFNTDIGATYFVTVARPTKKAGRFSLVAQRPDAPPTVPGTTMQGGTGKGHLDPLANPSDAWAVDMEKGTTYRLTLVTDPDECVAMTVFKPRARNFRTGAVADEVGCAGTEFFATGPDGGGTYPVLLTAEERETSYRLYVSPVEADDSGPGIPLESGQRMVGFVSPADPLDLYRFDVPGRSSVEIKLASKRYVDVELKDGYGRVLESLDPNTMEVHELDTGTYYLAVTPDEYRSRYSLRLMVRFVTTTWLTVDGTSSVTIGPGESVYLQTSTVPYPGEAVTEVQADFFDVASGKWVFRNLWEVAPGSSMSFTPDAVGRWRVRATFYPNDVASMSRSTYCSITVSSV
jgi:hypothetical protein